MNLLIPYVQMGWDHTDPALDEFTYGDVGQRARKLKLELSKGDYVFFHTTKRGNKCITAYYVVDRVIDTVAASKNEAIRAKYHNPHIIECLAGKRPEDGDDDAILFGDPITSRVLQRPLLFDRHLAGKLSLEIRFQPDKSDTQTIGSATRAWRELTEGDKNVLLKAIDAEQNSIRKTFLRSSEEVGETLEEDVEDFIAHDSTHVGKGLKLIKRQMPIGDGRIDLLFEDAQGDLVVVEVKLNRIGRDAVRQIKDYIHDLRKETNKKISGVIVCSGVMPAFKDKLRAQRDVRILVYGWDLRVEQW